MWNAKPKGGYSEGSADYLDNITEIYLMLKDSWTLEAISGMIGNLQNESGMNPWRWQSDSVSLTSDTKGYGLAQFTPAKGYIYDYGPGTEGFSPNLSVDGISGGTPQDGKAQIIVIDEDRAGKFLNRTSYCDYADISSCYPFSDFKKQTDLYIATVGWLFNYEFPADRGEDVAEKRYTSALTAYDFLKNIKPTKRTVGYLWKRYRRFRV